MWCAKLILLSCIGFAVSRPQNLPQEPEKAYSNNGSPIEVERQLIHEVTFPENDKQRFNNAYTSEKKVDESTKDILEKIALVNRRQGLTQKKPKPSYFHFPFSYSRAQDEEQQRTNNNFKFSRDPFTNPIFDYLEREKTNSAPSFRRPNFDNVQQPENYGISMTDSNPEILPEDNVPGQYIKRKITHYQSFMMPNPYNMFPQPAPTYPDSTYFDPQVYQDQNQGIFTYPNQEPSSKTKTALEKQTINNNMLPQQAPIYPDPNVRTYFNPQVYPDQHQGRFPSANQEPPSKTKNKTALEKQTINTIKDLVSGQKMPPVYNNYPYYQIPQFYAPNSNNKVSRQNWNWPGANLFPIYVRDPFLQMYYAVTNMIEYGPAAGNEGPCKLTPRPGGGSKVKPRGQQVTVEMNKREGEDEIKLVPRNIDEGYLDVEDIDLGDDDLVKLSVNLPIEQESREFKEKSDKMGWQEFVEKRNDTRLAHLASGKLDFNTKPPIKDQILQIEELEDESESGKAEDINISNDNVKRIFSRDNTGNGIFIHKLKVRKGGVAIAGPGGIATAGSGGTAIVGPNGIAYTHPNGLAIAGSGTQVVAVDPNIDLNEVIKNSVVNGTKHVANTRVGKVVAVGPVVYFNRGEDV